MKHIRKYIALTLCLTLLCGLLACAKSDNKQADASGSVTLKVGASITPHAEILREAAKILEKDGIILDIVEYDDYVQPNIAVDDGSLDANYFQHLPYLNTFNAENGTKLVSLGAVHYEPFGIYPGKTKSLSEVTDGATIGVPNDGSNETRALLLLQQEGLTGVQIPTEK